MIQYTCENCGTVFERARGDEGRGRACSIRCGRALQVFPSREVRFWKKVTKTRKCWLWTGARTSGINGGFQYGWLSTGPRGSAKRELAHRISWELAYGPVPPGLHVLHHCDNPPCVRPSHLFVGTAADNMHDRDRKGRQRAGTRKLTPFMVKGIRRRYAAKEKVRVIAADYNISHGHVIKIGKRQLWRHLDLASRDGL